MIIEDTAIMIIEYGIVRYDDNCVGRYSSFLIDCGPSILRTNTGIYGYFEPIVPHFREICAYIRVCGARYQISAICARAHYQRPKIRTPTKI